MSILATEWAERGHDVTLITFSSVRPDFYNLSPRVHRVRVSRKQPKDANRQLGRLRIILQLRRAIENSRPDVIVSFIDLTNILTLISTLRMRVPVIVSERTDPRCYQIPTIGRVLRRVSYPRAAALVVQTAAVAEWAEQLVGSGSVHIIPNPLRPSSHDEGRRSVELPAAPFVLAVGRLGREKGFDILIQAFGRALGKNPMWSLVILGKGPEEEGLRDLARSLGITSHVHFPGVTAEIDAVYREASVFVLSSRFEGFPNALLEAMAAGLPVIATDCRSGPREIVTHEIDGLLVRPGEIEDLQHAMERVMRDPELAQRLGRAARRVLERFSVEVVVNEWDQVLQRAQSNDGH